MRTALVTGASRGFGRGIAAALVGRGYEVVGVARHEPDLRQVQRHLGASFQPVVGDAADLGLAASLLARHRPQVLILNAGATPPTGPVHELTWEEFAGPWQADTRQAFGWVGAALRLPLDPGSVVVSISSGAALRGSPLSGGYAAAKAAVRFISGYAGEEAERAGLGLRFVCLLPQLSPATHIGDVGARAYAARQNVTLKQFVAAMPASLTPESVGTTVADIAADQDGQAFPERAYLLTSSGVTAVG